MLACLACKCQEQLCIPVLVKACCKYIGGSKNSGYMALTTMYVGSGSYRHLCSIRCDFLPHSVVCKTHALQTFAVC